MKEIIAGFKWLVGMLIKRTFVMLFVLSLAALGMVCYALYKVAMAYNLKTQEVIQQQDQTIKVQGMVIELQNKNLSKSRSNETDSSR